MTSILRQSIGIAVRIVIAAACCLGIWYSWKLARADYLFRQDTAASVRAAIGLVPDSWVYPMRMAQLDRAHARELLTTSLRLDHYNAQADIELALQYEADGDYDRAEKLMLEAYNVDHTYLPRWSLANFYLRRDNTAAFWKWAHSAATIPPLNMWALFELCRHETDDTDKITTELMNDNPEMIRQYIYYVLVKDELNAIPVVAQRLVIDGDAVKDHHMVFWSLNRMVEVNNAPAANALWHALLDHQWVTADKTVPYNGDFARDPFPVDFDWSLPEYPGLHSWPGSSGLATEFTGEEPEVAPIAVQSLSLAPGNYNLAFTYHTSGIAPDTGIRWQVIDSRLNTVLAQSGSLSSDSVTQGNLAFTFPPGGSFVRLQLGYQRALGTPRITGNLVMVSARVEPRP